MAVIKPGTNPVSQIHVSLFCHFPITIFVPYFSHLGILSFNFRVSRKFAIGIFQKIYEYLALYGVFLNRAIVTQDIWTTKCNHCWRVVWWTRGIKNCTHLGKTLQLAKLHLQWLSILLTSFMMGLTYCMITWCEDCVRMTESHMHNVETLIRDMYITCINFLEFGSHACLYELAIIVVQSGPNVVPGNMGSLEGQGYL